MGRGGKSPKYRSGPFFIEALMSNNMQADNWKNDYQPSPASLEILKRFMAIEIIRDAIKRQPPDDQKRYCELMQYIIDTELPLARIAETDKSKMLINKDEIYSMNRSISELKKEKNRLERENEKLKINEVRKQCEQGNAATEAMLLEVNNKLDLCRKTNKYLREVVHQAAEDAAKHIPRSPAWLVTRWKDMAKKVTGYYVDDKKE